MSKIVEWFLLPLFFIMSIIYAFNSFGQSIELKKVFHHKIDDVSLESAVISLYFSQDPRIQQHDQSNADKKIFFIPCKIMTEECQEMIERINKHTGSYSFTIEKTQSPEEGIVINCCFNPLKLALSYELFDSIGTQQKGVAFRLHNKEIIDALQHKCNQPILRMLSTNKKPCIVIDPGHGGGDSGAISKNGLMEKIICLAISKSVADLLQQHNCSVILTRQEDQNLLLEERTWCANQCHADLFISIHANSAQNNTSRGIETFCIQPSLFTEQFSTLAEKEKECLAQHCSNKAAVSHKLALSIQNNLCAETDPRHTDFKQPINRKVRYSVAQVLLGTQMPSVLVEVGFLSHPEEMLLLGCKKYHYFIAQRIVRGIMAVLTS